jgi:hypothetical protein
MIQKHKITKPDSFVHENVEKFEAIEKSVEGHAVPRFSIFKEYSTEKVETLIHCFMKRTTLKRDSIPATILADDGHVYIAVYDSRFPSNANEFNVVISFQKHTYGRFAVIRVVNEQSRRKF